MSPYIYCANNPVLYIDPDGRQLILSFKGTKEEQKTAQSNYESIVNNALGGIFIINIDSRDGFVSLESVVEGPLTERQQAFYDAFKKVVDSPEVVDMGVYDRNTDVDVGSWVFGDIDISDIKAFDNAGLGGASSAGA